MYHADTHIDQNLIFTDRFFDISPETDAATRMRLRDDDNDAVISPAFTFTHFNCYDHGVDMSSIVVRIEIGAIMT